MHHAKRSLSKAEYKKLIDVCNTYSDLVFLKLGVTLGLRREDMVNVKIADIDFHNKRLTYYEKKKARTRTVPISSSLVFELERYVRTLPKKQKDLLSFSGPTLYRRFQQLCERAGIPKRPVHVLRGTCVKFCQSAGWTPEEVSELIGDKASTVQEYYSVPTDEELAVVMEEKSII